jgi:hypothetical protein
VQYDAVLRLLNAFEQRGVRYAIFGGVALNLHGLARFTEDLDVFVAPDTQNIDTLKAALRDVYDDPEIDQISDADLLGDYPAVQYVPPDGVFHVDILTRLGDAFQFSDLETERIPFAHLTVTVVTPKMLHRMKRDTVRLKDKADAQLLRERFKIDEP